MQELTTEWENLITDDDRVSATVPALKRAILENLFYTVDSNAKVSCRRNGFAPWLRPVILIRLSGPLIEPVASLS